MDEPGPVELDPILVQLRDYRLRIRMTQEELAARLGVDHSRIGQMERGTNKLTLPVLRRWMDALGVDLTVKAKKRRNGT